MNRAAVLVALFGAAALVALAGACSSSTSGGGLGGDDSGAAGDDASASDGSSGGDAAASDAGADAPKGDFTTCEGACKTTTLAAMFKGTSYPFDRAQFGISTSDSGPPTVYVEAYAGGDPACPGPSSPTTDHTLILANLPLPTDTTPASSGVKASLFDFKGDILTAPLAKATSVTVTPRAAVPLSGSPRFVSYTVNATFPDGGAVTGGFYALHCDSLDN